VVTRAWQVLKLLEAGHQRPQSNRLPHHSMRRSFALFGQGRLAEPRSPAASELDGARRQRAVAARCLELQLAALQKRRKDGGS